MIVTHWHSGQADRVRAALLYEMVQTIRDHEQELRAIGDDQIEILLSLADRAEAVLGVETKMRPRRKKSHKEPGPPESLD